MKFSRRDLLLGCALSALMRPAMAWIHGRSGGHPQTLIGLDQTFPFVNFAKMMGHTPNVSLSNPYPTQINANGYPLTTGGGTLAANIPNNNGWTLGLPAEWTGNWIVFWTGKGAFQVSPGGSTPRTVVVTDTGSFTQSTTFSLALAGTMNGTTDKVVFNWGSNPPPANGSSTACYFPGGFSYDGTMANLVICRDNGTDEAIARANPNAFLPEYITQLKALNPRTIRPMDFNQTNGSNRSQSKYRAPTSSFSFGVDRFDPNVWVGTINGSTLGGTDTYTCGSYTDMPGSWTDKETFQGQFNFQNTGVPATINVGVRGAKTIKNITFGGLNSGDYPVGALATFVYDVAFDWVIVTPGGFQPDLPYELGVTLANTIGCDLWWNFPHFVDDASVTATVTYMAANLNSSHRAIFEYSNEVWNGTFGFFQIYYALNRGRLMGVPERDGGGGGDQRMPIYAFYGYRVGQIGALIRSARGGSTNMLTALASQGYNLALGFTDAFRFQGTDLGTRVAISGINNNAFCTVTTSTAHGLVAGDIVGIGGNTNAPSPFLPVSGMTVGQVGNVGPINGEYFAVGGSVTSNTFQIKNTIQTGTNTFSLTAGSTNIDSTGFGTYTSGGYVWKVAQSGRPIDIVDVISYATYSSGDTFTNADAAYQATNLAALNSAAASYVAGGGGVATGLNWIDNDYQNGTSSGANGSQCLLGLSNNLYPAWATLAAAYSGRTLECYEGACEMKAPSGARLTALGFTSIGDIAITSVSGATFNLNAHGLTANQPIAFSGTIPAELQSWAAFGTIYYVSATGLTANAFEISATPGGSVITTTGTSGTLNFSTGCANAHLLLLGYKNDSRFQVATTNQLSQFKTAGAGLPLVSPAWFQVYGPNSQWSAYLGNFNSVPFKSWAAMIAFNA